MRDMFWNPRLKNEQIKEEFYNNIYEIASHPVVRQMRKYPHHGNTSCYRHCLSVAFYTYYLCVIMGLDAKEAGKAAMLHDLFLYDWHTHARETGVRFHGLRHPAIALQNAQKSFAISDLERDMILKHMWPLTVIPPRYLESYIICLVDKYCCVMEFMKQRWRQ